VVRELERIGDNMVNIANAASTPSLQPLEPPVRSLIERMRDQAVAQLRVATDAFVVSDPGAAARLEEMDDVMDGLQLDLLQTVVFDAGNEVSVARAVKLALVSRYFERIADLAVNIGDRVRFMTRGEFDHYGRHRQAGRPPAAPT
jgi:phosphate transport system protein